MGNDTVPTDLRHSKINLKTLNAARNNSKTFSPRSLLTGIKKGLQPQTDSQKRPSILEILLQGGKKTFFLEYRDHIAEVPHSGEYELLGREDIISPGNDADTLAHALYSINHTPDIPGTIIQ